MGKMCPLSQNQDGQPRALSTTRKQHSGGQSKRDLLKTWVKHDKDQLSQEVPSFWSFFPVPTSTEAKLVLELSFPALGAQHYSLSQHDSLSQHYRHAHSAHWLAPRLLYRAAATLVGAGDVPMSIEFQSGSGLPDLFISLL